MRNGSESYQIQMTCMCVTCHTGRCVQVRFAALALRLVLRTNQTTQSWNPNNVDHPVLQGLEHTWHDQTGLVSLELEWDFN